MEMREIKQRCCVDIWRGFHSYPCAKSAKIERNGKWYCGTHDPVAREQKRDKRSAKFKIEMQARLKKRTLESAAPDLLKALELLLEACSTGEFNNDGTQRGIRTPERAKVDAARAALAKAKGE